MILHTLQQLLEVTLKKLGEEGYLAQEHISSGRTPTTEALKQYWGN